MAACVKISAQAARLINIGCTSCSGAASHACCGPPAAAAPRPHLTATLLLAPQRLHARGWRLALLAFSTLGVVYGDIGEGCWRCPLELQRSFPACPYMLLLLTAAFYQPLCRPVTL